jgi:hypothetical protein
MRALKTLNSAGRAVPIQQHLGPDGSARLARRRWSEGASLQGQFRANGLGVLADRLWV